MVDCIQRRILIPELSLGRRIVLPREARIFKLVGDGRYVETGKLVALRAIGVQDRDVNLRKGIAAPVSPTDIPGIEILRIADCPCRLCRHNVKVIGKSRAWE